MPTSPAVSSPESPADRCLGGARPWTGMETGIQCLGKGWHPEPAVKWLSPLPSTGKVVFQYLWTRRAGDISVLPLEHSPPCKDPGHLEERFWGEGPFGRPPPRCGILTGRPSGLFRCHCPLVLVLAPVPPSITSQSALSSYLLSLAGQRGGKDECDRCC